MSDDQATQLAALRKPFPAETVGKLPRVTCGRCRDASGKVCDKHTKVECKACGNWITTAHMHLDYVGHAEVTDRLLSVDPEWSWEPVAWSETGAPLISKGASGEWTLWIRLTVCGVTRLGVGTVSGGFDTEKQLIGDALRNAAMRFGVALDLWSKSELESATDETPAAPELSPAAKLAGIIRDQHPPAIGDGFKLWLTAMGYPKTPKDWSEAQMTEIRRWVEHVDATGEMPSIPESEPLHLLPEPAETTPVARQDENAASEGVTAPVTAENRSGASGGEPQDSRVAAAAEYVKGLDSAALLVEFSRRKLRAPRPVGEQRIALAAALVDDEAWQPATGDAP